MSKYKVWYVPQLPMKAFEVEVDDLKTANTVLNAIYDLSLFEYENRIKPDYADLGGIAVWNEEDSEWEDVEEELTDV